MAGAPDLTCVRCMLEATIASSRILAHPRGKSPIDLRASHFTGSPELIEAMRQAKRDGHRVELNMYPDVGVFAETTWEGDAVCLAHVLELALDRSNGYRRYG